MNNLLFVLILLSEMGVMFLSGEERIVKSE